MTGGLPTPQEAAQLLQLRELRVKRAHERRIGAAHEVTGAELAVHERQLLIHAGQSAMQSLAQAVVTSLATHLPRWNGMVDVHRACLAERLERDEDAMLDDARRLGAAREAEEQARIELTRARAREEVVRDLEGRARRGRILAAEQRSEVEMEDQGRAAVPRHGTPG